MRLLSSSVSPSSLCDDRPTVLRKMRSLEALDQLSITAAERDTFSDTAGGVTLQMIQARVKDEAKGA